MDNQLPTVNDLMKRMPVQENGYGDVYYQITNPGSWSEAIAPCVSDWPEDDNFHLDLKIFKEVSMVLQEKGIIATNLWAPIRRSSNYGPLHFNYDTLVNGNKLVI